MIHGWALSIFHELLTLNCDPSGKAIVVRLSALLKTDIYSHFACFMCFFFNVFFKSHLCLFKLHCWFWLMAFKLCCSLIGDAVAPHAWTRRRCSMLQRNCSLDVVAKIKQAEGKWLLSSISNCIPAAELSPSHDHALLCAVHEQVDVRCWTLNFWPSKQRCWLGLTTKP